MTTTLGAEDFLSQADPYRRELLAHCYRMLGSVHDAEDLVQETYLKAWRAHDQFEGRSSLRTWLYGIATNTCLTALKNRNRRPMPTGLGGPTGPDTPLVERPEVPWLEPIPDARVGVDESDPASIVTSRESIRLALIAALQHLPARQRVVLILRDVLAWRASEVADLLGQSVAAVNSMLQRARAQLDKTAPTEEGVTEPTTADQRDLLDRYMTAFHAKDVPAIVQLFSDDVVWEMPPFDAWFRGRDNVAAHLKNRCPGGPGDFRFLPAEANGQPALAMYLREAGTDEFRAFILQVLTFGQDSAISHVANFMDTTVFEIFDLPMSVPPTLARTTR